LEIAAIVPQFRRGSGGHTTLARLLRGLEARGHACSVWIEDLEGRHASESPPRTAALFEEFFGPIDGPVHSGLGDWSGADVVLATAWQTVARAMRLEGCGARAYLVQDHEPDFYGASAERLWAEQSYRLGLHCVCASAWLAGVLGEHYGASTSSFALGVDHAVYRPDARSPRREDRVLLYARSVTPRRAVPLALLALEEVKRRRPHVEVALFGGAGDVAAPFAHRDLGTLDDAGLASAYREATVGVVLSMTNPSLVPTEMLACGLPVVELASESMRTTFGADGPLVLAPADPLALADAVVALLDDPADRAERAAAGRRLAAGRTWEAAAERVEAGLWRALEAARAPQRP
jgi:glycosyltransferase involved in cell wall biosynthesis